MMGKVRSRKKTRRASESYADSPFTFPLPLAPLLSSLMAWKIANIRSSTNACGPRSLRDILRDLEADALVVRERAVPPPFLRRFWREVFMKRMTSRRGGL